MTAEHCAEIAERVIGRFGGSSPGPLVVSVGGMHGNEPAGVLAARNVLRQLRQRQPGFRGDYLALAGNLPALRRRVRFIDEDLNRIWRPEGTDRAEADAPDPESTEEAERQELLAELRLAISRASGPVYVIDLHTTSAPGSPFVIVADTLLNRRLALALPVPIVLGLEEHLSGTLLNFVNDLGHVAVGLEGGQHDSPTSVAMHELGIWQTLQLAGCVDAARAPALARLGRRVGRRLKGTPRIVELRYRHGVEAADAFVMEPGFEHLMRVRHGELLGRDQRGPVRSPESGLILMPLYQPLGNDGYFLVRSVWPFWLEISQWMRGANIDRLLPLLPGVHRHTGERDTLNVDPRIARWFVVQIFHLLGFRRHGAEDGTWLFSRRIERPSPTP
jgi:hypothetical protein